MHNPYTFESPISKRPLLNYLLYLPPDFAADSSRSWPLVLFLHGFGERGDTLPDLELLKLHGLPRLIESGKDFPFIIASPQCSRQSWWTLKIEALKDLVESLAAHYPVVRTRIYLTGLSMGGYGSWSLSIAYPELFAAVAPICGGGVRSQVSRLKDVPVWAFHGALDDIVPPYRSQEMVEALQNIGGNARLTIYPNLTHNSWSATYDNPELYEWFLSHHKSR